MKPAGVGFGGAVLAATFIAMFALPGSALAHEHVTVGEYEFIVGWRIEPPFVGVLNGLDLGIERHVGNATEWVTGAESSLTATLSMGGSSVVKAIEPQFGQPGWYTFEVLPTREGVYSVRIHGTAGTTAIDFTQALAEVTASSGIEFPIADPTPSDLQQELSDLATENAALRAQGASLQSQATIALAVGVLGLLAGLASIGLGMRAMRERGSPPT